MDAYLLRKVGWTRFCVDERWKILEVTNCDLALIGANLVDARGMYIVPGFVCMHAHGGGGHDFTECTEEAFRTAIAAHMKHGATSFFPTLSSSPFSEIRKAVDICEKTDGRTR